MIDGYWSLFSFTQWLSQAVRYHFFKTQYQKILLEQKYIIFAHWFCLNKNQESYDSK